MKKIVAAVAILVALAGTAAGMSDGGLLQHKEKQAGWSWNGPGSGD